MSAKNLFQVFCLEHRSYTKHNCPKADRNDVTVVICPLCAKGVRLIPDQDANITWENHVNTDCDPSNYERVKKKKKCPAPGCREILVFSNTIKCRDCTVDHCLKHRFGPDHKCPGPKKSETTFSFMSFMNGSTKQESMPNPASTTSSSGWTISFLNVASNILAWQIRDGVGQNSGCTNGTGQVEKCPQCGAKFSSATTLADHVQKVHERSGNLSGAKKVKVDACPKCSKGFVDPMALVEHIERDHGGYSRA
ncbi:hypothetical protein L6164_009389 [Bauhinia variegata]|uniref:Uncharacterized protein n=1 Tax=Bauhinia variegata TaxID=167791 RepID=A0ACB9PJY2_BAUVA|nr:hypothetical protein L6164_009389 [Bauhinia variegata]